MRIIAQAQSDAREIMVSSDSNLQMEVNISESVTQRMQFQEEKRQRNITSVVQKAAEELDGKDVDDSDTDHDWTARFFNYVQDISSKEMQTLWGRVLAGEVERSGNTSVQTLSILRNLDRQASELFAMLGSICVSLKLENGICFDSRVLTLGHDAANNGLQSYGLDFRVLSTLNEHGLVISDYNSWAEYMPCVLVQEHDPQIPYPFTYGDRKWCLVPSGLDGYTAGQLRLHGVALTQSGRELLQVVHSEPMQNYTQALRRFFQSKNLRMATIGDSSDPNGQ